MSEKIITLLGGNGFLGRYVVRELAKAGFRLRVVCRAPDKAQALKTYGDLGQIDVVKGDIRSPNSLAPHVAGAWGVVNLVGILFEKKRGDFDRLHHQAAGALAELARQAGVQRFVHVSALGTDKAKDSLYASSKQAGELAVRQAFPQADILRPSVLFGPEDDFFNQFARMAVFSPALPLIGGGRTLFQPVYVVDVAKAVAACLNPERVPGGMYELGGPEVFSFRQILEFILLTTHRRRRLLRLPFGLAEVMALFFERLPKPPLTRDQLKLLRHDNVLGGPSGLAQLGIKAHAVEMVVPDYLARFRNPLHA